MVTKDKLIKIKTYPRKTPLKLLKLSSSWTASVPNEKLWMKKADIYSEFPPGLGLKRGLYPQKAGKDAFAPRVFSARTHALGACECLETMP